MFNCTLWIIYGVEINEGLIVFTNSFGYLITQIWIVIFIVYFLDKDIIKIFLFVIGNILFFSSILFLFHYGIDNSDTTGLVAMIFNIFVYVSPCQQIYEVIKTYNYKILPVEISICAFICSLCWTIYGVYLNDFKVIVPNLLGIVFSLVQIIVFIYSYSQTIIKNINNDEIISDIKITSLEDEDNTLFINN